MSERAGLRQSSGRIPDEEFLGDAELRDKTLRVGDLDYAHRVGDTACDKGWCDAGERYPKPCENGDCPGLVHADFGDEDWDGYWLYTKCDACGESE